MHTTEVSSAAVWVGAAAIVLAAAIAGVVAVWRTKHSLVAEGDRLDSQLGHDRSLRDRAELRELIDETLSAAQDGIYAGVNMQTSILAVSRGVTNQEGDERYAQAKVEMRAAVRTVNRMQSRLSVRLSSERGGLPIAVHNVRAALDLVSFYASAAWPDSDKADRDELQSVIKTAEGRLDEFEDLARALVEARL